MTFPQNAYVLEILKYVKRSAKEKRDKFEQCKEHERDLSLYCQNVECQVEICQLCIIKEHCGHKVVDILEEFQRRKGNQVEPLIRLIKVCREKFKHAKKEMELKKTDSLSSLKKQKEMVVNIFDNIIENTRKKARDSKKEITDYTIAMTRHIEQLENIQERAVPSKSDDSILDEIEKFLNEMPGGIFYEEYVEPNQYEIEEICGKFKREADNLHCACVTSSFDLPTTNNITGKDHKRNGGYIYLLK